MEEVNNKKETGEMIEKEIVFSETVKAGKRIYYIDVKKSRNNDLFLAITESKKIPSSDGDVSKFSFEKHNIFLYKEDFEKFSKSLLNAIHFIEEKQGNLNRDYPENPDHATGENPEEPKADTDALLDNEIKLDIEF